MNVKKKFFNQNSIKKLRTEEIIFSSGAVKHDSILALKLRLLRLKLSAIFFVEAIKFFTRHFVFVKLFIKFIDAAENWTVGINHAEIRYLVKILAGTVGFSHMLNQWDFTNPSATSSTSFAGKHYYRLTSL